MVAYHEAGHGVVARLHGCTSIEVRMARNTKREDSFTYFTGDPDWLQRRATLEQRLDVDAAGHAAEIEFFTRGAWTEIEWQWLLKGPISAVNDRARAFARAQAAQLDDGEAEWLKAVDRATVILRQHWDEVEALAELAAPRGVRLVTLQVGEDKQPRWVVNGDLERAA